MDGTRFKDMAVITHDGDIDIDMLSFESFGSGQCLELGGFVLGDPLVLVPEGGVCRVEIAHKRQRCKYCGAVSWVDETIRCSGCGAQGFIDVL